MTQGTAASKQETAVVQWKGEPITITFHDVKNLICPLATDQETAIFLKTCQSLQLNPFADEVYLIKYGEKDKAATVIAIDSYLKASEANIQFDGYECGIILKDSTGKLDYREGAFLLDEERPKLVGGWAKVYRKDRNRPFYLAVNKKECIRYTKDGHLTQFWTEEKQPSMLRKVALKRALVEAFPSLFAGAISNVDYEMLAAEGKLPPAYEREGEPYWKLWWARQTEKGLSEDDVHNILGVASLKADWLEKGRTLEEAEDIINDTLEKRKAKVFSQRGKGPSPPAQGKRKADEIKESDIPDGFALEKIAFEVWGLQPKQVWDELNYSSAKNFQEAKVEKVWDCFLKLKLIHEPADEELFTD